MAELDAEYIRKMEDVLALHEQPYDPKEPAVCLDEKPVALHADVRPPRPARPGHVAKRDNEYQRCGTANIFGIVECEHSLTKHFGRRTGRRIWRRLTVHYTPKHGSWLNQAEIELSLVARQCLGTRRIPALAQLRSETRAWNRRANSRHTTINWRFTRKDARRKFGYKPNLFKRSET